MRYDQRLYCAVVASCAAFVNLTGHSPNGNVPEQRIYQAASQIGNSDSAPFILAQADGQAAAEVKSPQQEAPARKTYFTQIVSDLEALRLSNSPDYVGAIMRNSFTNKEGTVVVSLMKRELDSEHYINDILRVQMDRNPEGRSLVEILDDVQGINGTLAGGTWEKVSQDDASTATYKLKYKDPALAGISTDPNSKILSDEYMKLMNAFGEMNFPCRAAVAKGFEMALPYNLEDALSASPDKVLDTAPGRSITERFMNIVL